MLSREFQIKKDYAVIVTAYQETFPGVPLPGVSWVLLWMDRYSVGSILTVIKNLGRHPLKNRFTTASTGKAISTLLRQDALLRATACLKAMTSTDPTAVR
jgi:hypothetical protein